MIVMLIRRWEERVMVNAISFKRRRMKMIMILLLLRKKEAK